VVSLSWIRLDGIDNARDLGGLPTRDGGSIRRHRLLRSGNLQAASARDVRLLVDDIGVTTVVDLRKDDEARIECPGPMTREPVVAIVNLSLYPPASAQEGIPDPDRISWEAVDPAAHHDQWTGHYLTYLTMRPDSVVAALSAIAHAPGAALVHCAAGKDRTGTVVALALLLAGVTEEAIVEDYAASAAWVPRILERLRDRPAYRTSLAHATVDNQTPRADTMVHLLAAIRERYGDAENYLRKHGWTAPDTAALRARLLD